MQNKKILDIGCGAGLLSESLAKLGANVIAIDPSIKSIAFAKEHQEKSDNYLVKSNIKYF